MRVLDIDLDFFVRTAYCFFDGPRLDDKECRVWSIRKTEEFLENQCGLSKISKINGRFMTNHHEAFFFWRELIMSGLLSVPFEIVHIDAHADLGLGDGGWAYIFGKLLHRPVEDRPFIDDTDELLCGNYLAFAVACRWVSKITFITPPQWENDLNYILFKDFDDSSGFLQLRRYKEEDIEVFYDLSNNLNPKIKPIDFEPLVPFKRVKKRNFKNEQPLSFVCLSHSPNYTPAKIDKLIPAIMEYINPI